MQSMIWDEGYRDAVMGYWMNPYDVDSPEHEEYENGHTAGWIV